MARTPALARRIAACGLTMVMLIGLGTSSAGATPSDLPPLLCPAETGNRAFVSHQYQLNMGRCADAAGLSYWSGLLDSGTPLPTVYPGTRLTTVAEALTFSDEGLAYRVRYHYMDILDRQPTALELSQAMNRLRSDRSVYGLVAYLASSDEFFDKVAGSVAVDQQTDAWLNVIYGSLLHRSPDPGGRAFFHSILGTQSTQEGRFRVARIIAHSDESAQIVVKDLYAEVLHRPYDADGLAFWTQWLFTSSWGFADLYVRTLFTSTPEAYAFFSLPPS